eukprot:12406017-Karenia_brevis.AAC.1
MNQYNCAYHGLSYMGKFVDIKNAFYSLTHDDMYHLWHDKCGDELESEANVQLIHNHIAAKVCVDGIIMLNPDAGVPPGLCNAVQVFNHTYIKILEALKK